jgi:hypothetical protein
MTYYRLYFLGGGSGPISDFHEFTEDCDDAAVATADLLRRTAAMELWCRGRKVRRWEAVAAARASISAAHYRAGSISKLAP